MAGGRRSGNRFVHLLVAVACGALLYVVNRSPGWQDLPVLTGEFGPLVPWVNALLGLTLAAILILLFLDAPVFGAFALVAVSALGIWVAFRLLAVFPFSYDALTVGATVVRVVLVAGMVGGLILVIVGVARILRN